MEGKERNKKSQLLAFQLRKQCLNIVTMNQQSNLNKTANKAKTVTDAAFNIIKHSV